MAWNQPGKKNEKPSAKRPAPFGDGGRNSALPPELDDILKKLNAVFGSSFSPKKITTAVLLALLLVFGVSGVHQVGADEEAAVFRFGKLMARQDAGLHWHVPAMDVVRVVNVQRLEQAVVTADVLTADENILGISMVVHYRIGDEEKYLRNFADPETVLVHAAESALREVAAASTMAELVRDDRTGPAENILRKLQLTLAPYSTGMVVSELSLTDVLPGSEVRSAFDAVLNAREAAGEQQAKAAAAATKSLSAARMKAAGMLAAAEVYRNESVGRARADAARLEPLLPEYAKAPELVRNRLRDIALKDAQKTRQKAEQKTLGKKAATQKEAKP